MKTAYDILRRPLVTEKSNLLKENNNQIVLEVARGANKMQIQDAAKSLFGVEVTGVRTMNYRGKIKKVGKSFGKRRSWKKAILSLKEGADVDVFGIVSPVPEEEGG